MRPDDIRNWLEFRPFQPFRLHVTGGATFEIRSPDHVMVERSTLRVATGEPFPKRDFMVALLHITHLEPID